MEIPLFFKNKNYNLFGVLHEPDYSASLQPPPSNLNRLGLVFCQPFAEEKLIAHRVMVNLARTLTAEGICCFRFDYMGHGDSDGNFEDSTTETRLSDIQCAVDFLRMRSGIEKVGLLGVRFGATLAALTYRTGARIDFLILISPIVEGRSYIDQCLRSNLTTQLAMYRKIVKYRKQLINELMADQVVNIDGYLLTKTLYQEIEAISLLTNALVAPKNVLIVQVSKKKNQPFDEKYEQLYRKYKGESEATELLNVKEDFFWTDTKMYNPKAKNIQEALLGWLLRVYT